jgi:hypothetical protein
MKNEEKKHLMKYYISNPLNFAFFFLLCFSSKINEKNNLEIKMHFQCEDAVAAALHFNGRRMKKTVSTNSAQKHNSSPFPKLFLMNFLL